jgi:hypothetical protein
MSKISYCSLEEAWGTQSLDNFNKNNETSKMLMRDNYELLNKKSEEDRDNVITNMNAVERNEAYSYDKYRTNNKNNVKPSSIHQKQYGYIHSSSQENRLRSSLDSEENRRNYNNNNSEENRRNYNSNNSEENRRNYNNNNSEENRRNYNNNNSEENRRNYNNNNSEENRRNYNSNNSEEKEYTPFKENIDRKYLEDKLLFLENQLKKYKILIDNKSENNDTTYSSINSNLIEKFSNSVTGSESDSEHVASNKHYKSNDIIDLLLLIIIGLLIIFVMNSIFTIGKSIGMRKVPQITG